MSLLARVFSPKYPFRSCQCCLRYLVVLFRFWTRNVPNLVCCSTVRCIIPITVLSSCFYSQDLRLDKHALCQKSWRALHIVTALQCSTDRLMLVLSRGPQPPFCAAHPLPPPPSLGFPLLFLCSPSAHTHLCLSDASPPSSLTQSGFLPLVGAICSESPIHSCRQYSRTA